MHFTEICACLDHAWLFDILFLVSSGYRQMGMFSAVLGETNTPFSFGYVFCLSVSLTCVQELSKLECEIL